MILQANPKANYLSHKKEIDHAILKVLTGGRYILNEQVKAFENEFAQYLNIKDAIGVATGTDAIEIALRSCGIKSNDYVATVSHTAVATVCAIERLGAKPVFVDINTDTLTMCVDSLKKILNHPIAKKIKAIIPVHIYGHPANMPAIMKIVNKKNIYVIEDCAQAHGAKIGNKTVGSFGHAGAFSFYPTKNLGAIGDGGAVVTNSLTISRKIRILREYGWKKRYISLVPGINSRLDEIQAAILRIKLKYLDEENSRRRTIANLYFKHLENTNIQLPSIDKNAYHVFHQFVICSNKRNLLMKKLKNKKIHTLIHYPQPIHLQPAYSNKTYCPEPLINTENLYKKILSLPMYPELSDHKISFISKKIIKILNNAN